jgi:hypothetical protein
MEPFRSFPAVGDDLDDHLEQTEGGADSNFATALTTATSTQFQDAPKAKKHRV